MAAGLGAGGYGYKAGKKEGYNDALSDVRQAFREYNRVN